MSQYDNLVFAGTFDHLHVAHERMLDKAFSLAKRVSIGITTKKMYRTKVLSKEIETYTRRKNEVESYLRKRNVLKKAMFFQLNDPLGPSVIDSTMDSILVSEETAPAARFINTIRKKRNLRPLVIHIMHHFSASDRKPITSERIRLGEIDRNGKVYLDLFQKKLLLPEHLRETLRIPLGTVIKGEEKNLHKAAKKAIQVIRKTKPSMIVGVGDVVNTSFVTEGFIPDVQIIDLKTRRKKIKSNSKEKKVVNKAGTIEKKAVSEIKKSFDVFLLSKKKQKLVINGEEDLLALPAILLAPLGSVVLYGQYDLGIVMVTVDESTKKQITNLLKNFIPQE